MKRIIVNFESADKKKVSNLFVKYNNISIFRCKNSFKIQLFLNEDQVSMNLLELIEKKFKNLRLEKIKKNHDGYKKTGINSSAHSNLFFISRTKKKNNKKFGLVISNNRVFGTGGHESTLLAIQHIESIIKKRNFFNILDLGTGSGILSFVLRKITFAKIVATDNDIGVFQFFKNNMKVNMINKIFFCKADGFKSKLLKKKYDLIVSNLLLNNHKNLIKQYFLHLKNNGILLISGILISQQNEIIHYLNKFNIKLKKKLYINDWISLIFVKRKRNINE